MQQQRNLAKAALVVLGLVAFSPLKANIFVDWAEWAPLVTQPKSAQLKAKHGLK